MLKIEKYSENKTVITKSPSGGIDVNEEAFTKSLSISFDADVFIVPNALGNLSNMPESDAKRRADMLKKIYTSNGGTIINADPSKPLVDLWWSSEDLKSENLCDHGANIPGLDIHLQPTLIGYLPVNLFTGMTDGDTVNITVPGYELPEVSAAQLGINSVDLHITAHLNQMNYRYRTFGKFGNCLACLLQVYYKDKKKPEAE